VHDFERDEFVVGGIRGGNEEERGIAAVDYLGVCCVNMVVSGMVKK
jgi:hypothetical protein